MIARLYVLFGAVLFLFAATNVVSSKPAFAVAGTPLFCCEAGDGSTCSMSEDVNFVGPPNCAPCFKYCQRHSIIWKNQLNTELLGTGIQAARIDVNIVETNEVPPPPAP